MKVVPRRPVMDCGCFSVAWKKRELPPLKLPELEQVAAYAPNTSKYESSHCPERSQEIYGATTQSSISANSYSSSVQPSFCSSLNSENHLVQSSPYASFSFENTTFMYEDLIHATNDFSDNNLIGRGGFGNVYIGKLKDGREVAIKQLKDGSSQGEREFQAEVETITRVHHRCLVSLVGYCLSTTRRLLVYEYVTNGSLEFHLHGKGQSLDWATRMKIALGSAKGLKYLHEDCHPKIIHRDIKSANILLDKNFEAKVADFGLARFQLDANTHVSTRVVGTLGYLAPEYALTGKITDMSDVFSFGVLLLELITGRRPIGRSQGYLDDNIIDWARPLLLQTLESKNFDQVADPRLEKNYNSLEMERMVACASACVHHLARHRARMRQVVHALQGMLPLDGLKRGTRDMHIIKVDSHGCSEFEASTLYRDDLKRIMNMSLENNTSECSTSPLSEFSTQTQVSSSVQCSLPTTRSMEL